MPSCRGIATLLLGVGLTGCAKPAPVCTAPAGTPMLEAELFFGRNIAPAYQRELGPTVTDVQWAAFTQNVLTPAFPDGMTALDAKGQWRDPASGVIGHEPTKMVIIGAPDTAQTRARLETVIERYRTEFHQEAVGLMLHRACAHF